MSYRSSYHTAVILAAALNQSEQTRARVSLKTLRMASQRRTLRNTFVSDVISDMAKEFDWIMFEISSGGFGVIQSKSLEAARPITLVRSFDAAILRIIRRGEDKDVEKSLERIALSQQEPLDEDED